MRPSSLLYANDAQLYRDGSAALLDMLVDGMVAPAGAAYPLAKAGQAHADLESGTTTGSIILTV